MAFLEIVDLTNANFFEANLTNADLLGTPLSADFTNAEVRGADFTYVTPFGFMAAQLYSTASYQELDLTGIGLAYNDISGWDFAGQTIAHADFSEPIHRQTRNFTRWPAIKPTIWWALCFWATTFVDGTSTRRI